jgi:hypothetical protein
VLLIFTTCPMTTPLLRSEAFGRCRPVRIRSEYMRVHALFPCSDYLLRFCGIVAVKEALNMRSCTRCLPPFSLFRSEMTNHQMSRDDLTVFRKELHLAVRYISLVVRPGSPKRRPRPSFLPGVDKDILGMPGNRQLSLLLVLASLGAALIIYRLALIGERHSKPGSQREPRANYPESPSGHLEWRKRIVAVGDLHGGTPRVRG